jgi:hypothetical protein
MYNINENFILGAELYPFIGSWKHHCAIWDISPKPIIFSSFGKTTLVSLLIGTGEKTNV